MEPSDGKIKPCRVQIVDLRKMKYPQTQLGDVPKEDQSADTQPSTSIQNSNFVVTLDGWIEEEPTSSEMHQNAQVEQQKMEEEGADEENEIEYDSEYDSDDNGEENSKDDEGWIPDGGQEMKEQHDIGMNNGDIDINQSLTCETLKKIMEVVYGVNQPNVHTLCLLKEQMEERPKLKAKLLKDLDLGNSMFKMAKRRRRRRRRRKRNKCSKIDVQDEWVNLSPLQPLTLAKADAQLAAKHKGKDNDVNGDAQNQSTVSSSTNTPGCRPIATQNTAQPTPPAGNIQFVKHSPPSAHAVFLPESRTVHIPELPAGPPGSVDVLVPVDASGQMKPPFMGIPLKTCNVVFSGAGNESHAGIDKNPQAKAVEQPYQIPDSIQSNIAHREKNSSGIQREADKTIAHPPALKNSSSVTAKQSTLSWSSSGIIKPSLSQSQQSSTLEQPNKPHPVAQLPPAAAFPGAECSSLFIPSGLLPQGMLPLGTVPPGMIPLGILPAEMLSAGIPAPPHVVQIGAALPRTTNPMPRPNMICTCPHPVNPQRPLPVQPVVTTQNEQKQVLSSESTLQSSTRKVGDHSSHTTDSEPQIYTSKKCTSPYIPKGDVLSGQSLSIPMVQTGQQVLGKRRICHPHGASASSDRALPTTATEPQDSDLTITTVRSCAGEGTFRQSSSSTVGSTHKMPLESKSAEATLKHKPGSGNHPGSLLTVILPASAKAAYKQKLNSPSSSSPSQKDLKEMSRPASMVDLGLVWNEIDMMKSQIQLVKTNVTREIHEIRSELEEFMRLIGERVGVPASSWMSNQNHSDGNTRKRKEMDDAEESINKRSKVTL